MEENDIWNPTQRLYDLLEKTKEFAKVKNNQYQVIREVWASVFGVDSTDTIAIFYNLTLLSQSLDWTKAELDKVSLRRKEIYTRNLSRVHNALNLGNLDTTWNTVENLLNDETMADLLHCADRLAESSSETELNEEELDNLNGELDSLTKLFHESDLDSDLRIAILDLLETSRQMLAEYRIRGSEVLKNIIELSLGKLMTKRTELSEASKDTKINKLFSWLKKVDGIYGRLGKYAPLLQGASQALLAKIQDG